MTDTGGSSLASAAAWLEGTLLGSIATVIAVIAIATVGFLMLSGRIDWRRGAGTVIGCFILFGAPTIAAGIVGAARSGQGDHARAPAFEPMVMPAPNPPASAQPRPVCWTCGNEPSATPSNDPYAGASVR